MKTVSKIALLALVGLSFTSCNKEKDWQCVCTVNGSKTTGIIHDETKKDAREECKKVEQNTLATITDCHLDGPEK